MEMKGQIHVLRLENPIIAKDIIQRQMKKQSELSGGNFLGGEFSLMDATYNLEYLFSAIEADSKLLFDHYNRWTKQLFANRQLAKDALEKFYACAGEVFAERFQQGLVGKDLFLKLKEYLELGIRTVKNERMESIPYYKKENPFQSFLDKYSNFVFAGDRNSAVQFIKEISTNDIEIKDIYKYILQPFQLELGNLWHENKINVAQEHYATAVSQVAMSMLYEKIFATPKKGKTLLGTCIQGELHEFGIRMVCDYMESCSWDTYYLGANMPNKGIVEMINEKRPDILAISCTMIFNLSQLQELVHDVRCIQRSLPIIVGGYPFNLDQNLWHKVGADAYSADFEHAYLLSEQLLGDCKNEVF